MAVLDQNTGKMVMSSSNLQNKHPEASAGRLLGVFASDMVHLSPAASYIRASSKKMIGALVRYDLEHPIAVSCYTQMTSLPGV
jgi:hypothetical protein